MNNKDDYILIMRTLDLADLHIFRTVARTGGITRAARQLHRVQSNITVRIQKLEEELGIDLFLREGKKLELSPAGRTLLDYADQLLALAEEARENLHADQPSGLLKLGTVEYTAAARLPKPLSEYHRLYPEVNIELRTGPTRQMLADLLNGEIDAALVAGPVSDERLASAPVYKEELVIVAEQGHKRIRSPKDVADKTLLAFQPGCTYRQRLENWFTQDGLQPERVIELASYHTILGCVIAGMGIALLPRNVLNISTQGKLVSVHPLKPPDNFTTTVLTWRSAAGSAKIEALLKVLCDTKT